MAMTSSELTEQQQADFMRVFHRFDRDGSGTIDRTEMKHMLQAFGFQHLTQEDLDAILAKIDADLSGTVSQQEFMDFMSIQTEALDKEISQSIFDIIDHDNDGEIDLCEFTHVVNSLNPQVKDAEIEKMFHMADRDGQGTVDREEFREALRSKQCSIWRELGLSLATVGVIREVVEQYSRLAKDPKAGFGTMKSLPYGSSNAKRLGYQVEKLPEAIWESACQCANVFEIAEKPEDFVGATVVEFGCGAGADLCVAAGLVGSSGKVIGIDMNRPMIKKAGENIANCGLSEIASAHIGIFDTPELPQPVTANMADFVLVNGTINLSPRKLCALKNVFKTLKVGGTLLMADVVVSDPSVKLASGKGSWCDCVAGAVPLADMEVLLKKVGFTGIYHVGYSDYLTSPNTPTAKIRAIKEKA